MGCRTDYTISSDDGLMEEYHLEVIKAIAGYEDFTSVKWYTFETDMKNYSKIYPNVLFAVEYSGRMIFGDIGIRYFKNGKTQDCKATVTFERFDKSKLK